MIELEIVHYDWKIFNVGCLLGKVKTTLEKMQTCRCTCHRYLT